MTLAPGAKHGVYEILAPLGAGGMGEVWRAHDVRLRRDVAIKALPPGFASDAERLARFDREARLLAALNHPNVAVIYGIEEAGGAPLLVMELVDGESLAQRLATGPLSIEEALFVGAQIAAGLEAAHGAGVIHRDLKPANIMVRPDGSAKILDLGLARAIEPATVDADPSLSPTVTSGPTAAGVILGTAAYMSPEQARGRQVDKRTDVFSFGCVLYECLTGTRAFPGETVSDSLAAVLKSEPDWAALPAETPARVRDLLRRCLRKDPKRRLHDVADARIEIEEAAAEPVPSPVEPGPREVRRPRQVLVLWVAAGILVGAVAAFLATRGPTVTSDGGDRSSIRSSLPLPADTRVDTGGRRPSMAFSPDGASLVFRAVGSNGAARLYMRTLDRPEVVPIPGSEDGFNPFFSPDGEWLAFFTAAELKKVSVTGGQPLRIATVTPVTQGGTWGSDGYIYFPPFVYGGISRVAAAGGTAESFISLDSKSGERAHAWPQALPDGEHLLLIVRSREGVNPETSSVAIHSLKTGRRRTILQGSSFAQYVPPGRILFVRGRSVQSVPVDPKRWELTGKPVTVLRDVLIATADETAHFAAFRDRLLAYAAGGLAERPKGTLVWVDREGQEEPIPLPPQSYYTPRLSPDGRTLAVVIVEGTLVNVWTYDFARNTLAPLVPEPGTSFSPVWTPDGLRLVFSREEGEWLPIFWRAADGGGAIEALTTKGELNFATSISPDGRLLAYASNPPGKFENTDIWVLSFDGKRERRAWLATPFDEYAPFFSPDGRWIAYVSVASGHRDVYVRPFPGPGGQTRISADGGAEPAWSADGKELFYRTGDRLMAVRVEASSAFRASSPRVLLAGTYRAAGSEDAPRLYDVTRDGRRFLFIKPLEKKEDPITRFELVVNWPAALGRARKDGE
ncbi:MAG TPA: protein kinase [Thermoanaerobaculia bacterium]|nr:protein kinase [Thermoanaerobaculia bacterium]